MATKVPHFLSSLCAPSNPVQFLTFETYGARALQLDSGLYVSKEACLQNVKKQEEAVTHTSEAESIQNRVAKLDAQIFEALADRRKASIDVGLALIEQRKLLPHGKWLAHFNEVLAPNGLKLRTAQRWMKRARKAESDLRNVTVAHSESASDSGAQAIKTAAKQDEADVRAVADPKESRKGARPYSLPLHLTEEEQKAMDALQKSAAWFQAEKKVVRLLRNFCIEQGVMKNTRRKS